MDQKRRQGAFVDHLPVVHEPIAKANEVDGIVLVQGDEASLLHATLGGGADLQNPGLRRVVINGV